jgi:hypothetical protein
MHGRLDTRRVRLVRSSEVLIIEHAELLQRVHRRADVTNQLARNST